MKDIELIKALKLGNTTGLKHCYKHLPSVKNYILKNSGTEEDVYDIFQETVLIFYTNVIKNEFVLTSTLNTYLMSICKNIWFNKLRKKEKEQHIIEYIMKNENKFHNDDFESEHEIDLMDGEIKQFIESLKEPCKSILISYYFHNLSLKLIAKKMNYESVQVVRQQKYRCIKKIKDMIKRNN